MKPASTLRRLAAKALRSTSAGRAKVTSSRLNLQEAGDREQHDVAADISLIERFSRHWDANSQDYKQMLPAIKDAARRLLPLLQAALKGQVARDEKIQKLLALEYEVFCLARQPLFFPEMFHGVTLQPDGGFQALHPLESMHLRANGLLGTGDRDAIRQVYERLLAHNHPLRVIEIGSAGGRGSTPIGGEIVKRSGGILYCIDPWIQLRYFSFLANVQIYDLEHTVVPIRGMSGEVAVLFEDHSFDAVFVDGSHIYPDVLADIDAYLPKIKKGGIMFGHDMHDLPSRFDRSELLAMSKINNGMASYRNARGEVERADVHPGVILAVQDRFGDDVEHFPGSVVWLKQL